MRTRVVALTVVATVAGATGAEAHGAGVPVLPSEMLRDWHPDALPVLLICVLGIAYAVARFAMLRAHGMVGALSHGKATAFCAGLALFATALASPLESLAGTLLSAHMVQHVILITIAPLLIVIARADVVFFRQLPPARRRSVGRAGNKGVWRHLLQPIPAALLHGVVILLWHAPPLFNAALTNDLVHDFEHLSFVVTALLFWFAVANAARSASRRLAGGIAILITLIFGGALGALLTLAPRPLYAYPPPPAEWGLALLSDQQLAGLLMWVPTGAFYLLAGMFIALAIVSEERKRDEPRLLPR